MINEANFSRAYAETEEILNHMLNEDLKKIDPNFLKMINKRKDKKYKYKLDKDKSIEEQVILKETKSILAYIFFNYLATEREKKIIKERLKKDILEKG